LLQSIKNIKKKIFLNFEDTRIPGFELNDFNKLGKIATANNVNCLIFDEIQNIAGWEKYVRSAFDKGFKIYITGSNASMLSRELGTKLTGRYLQIELTPFNYKEYLRFKKVKKCSDSFNSYLINGGFPEYLSLNQDEYLRTLMRDIVIRDVAVRRNIKNENVLLRLTSHLLSNVGKEISFNNISKTLEIKSVRTTIDYSDFLKESYLLFFVPRFSYSIKQQLNNPKKVYAVDTALARANSLSFSEDNGRMLENAVYLHLRRMEQEVFYFKSEKSECDFLVKKNEKIISAIQVCWNLSEDNLKREIDGINKAKSETGAKSGIIITFDQEDTFGNIKVIPAWKWMTE